MTQKKTSRWIRWLSKLGCSTKELVAWMHHWGKYEEDRIRAILSELGHDVREIETHIEKLIYNKTINSMEQTTNTQDTGLREAAGQLIQRLQVNGKADMGHLAGWLKQAGFTAQEIAQGLRNSCHAVAEDVTKALHDAAFSLREISDVLRQDWQMSATTVCHLLKMVEQNAQKVVQVVQQHFKLGEEDVTALLHNVWNYSEEAVQKIKDAGKDIAHVAQHLLDPLKWFHQDNQPQADTTNAHAFVKALQQNDALQQKLSIHKQNYVNGVTTVAREAGYELSKEELSAAMSKVIPSASGEQQVDKEDVTAVGVLWETYGRSPLIKQNMYAALHRQLIEAAEALQLACTSLKIESNMVYLYVKYPATANIHRLIQTLCHQTSDGMKKIYPELDTITGGASIWKDDIEILTDTEPAAVQTKMDAMRAQ